jgi:DNA-directed RNA polymerase specialized sigma24 family protein
LFALQQWPAEQVARRLGISVDLVYQNKRRMLARIRQLLTEMGEE